MARDSTQLAKKAFCGEPFGCWGILVRIVEYFCQNQTYEHKRNSHEECVAVQPDPNQGHYRRGGVMLLGLMLMGGTATSVHAQGQIASGTISGSGSGPYTYNLSFSDSASATSPIGSVWYGWIPFAFYLPGVPTGASAPAGWTASVDANSSRYSANSAAND